MKGLLRLKARCWVCVWKVRQPLRITSACPKPTLQPTQPKVACGPPNRAPYATIEPPLRKVGCSEYELLPLALPSALHGRYHLSPQRSPDRSRSGEWREGTLTAGESCGTVSREVKFRNGVVAGRGEGVRPTPVFR